MKTNFDLGFSAALVLRTPAYSCTDYQTGTIPLHDPYFRTAIQIATPVLYRELEKKQFNLQELNQKETLSLLKYFNRMCFRPTPFGLFAGISVTSWSQGSAPVIVKNTIKAHSWPSWDRMIKQANEFKCDSFIANPTIYFAGNEYRFLCSDAKKEGTFYINSIEYSDAVKFILEVLKVKRSEFYLIGFIEKKFNESWENSKLFIQDLSREQFIISALHPNITGIDFYDRMQKQPVIKAQTLFSKSGIGTKAYKLSKHNLQRLIGLAIPEDAEHIGKSPLYVVSERPVDSGGVPVHLQSQIRDVLQFTQKLNDHSESDGLLEFITAFTKKYDQQWVPLMEALDPETGVSYMSLGSRHNHPALLEDLHIGTVKPKTKQYSWSATHKLLVNKLLGFDRSADEAILLNEPDLITLDEAPAAKFPPSISVVFRLADGKMLLEHAGGVTANALIGRFTPVNKQIEQLAKEIVEHEQANNPDVVFAEILHLTENHAANIERRSVIYPYEIPVTAISTQPANFQIQVSDLMVGVQDGEILLWSNRIGKRVIPRLSTAYNYQRTNISVLRFLCDLQHHRLQSNLGFDIVGLLPDLDFYPRIEYKDVILSLSTWKIREADVKQITSATNPSDQLSRLIALISRFHIPEYISINEYDNQLVMNTSDITDLQFMLQLLANAKEILIKEHLPDISGNISVKDRAGRPYQNQFVTTLYNTSEVYQKIDYPVYGHSNHSKLTRKFMIGSQWLYLKIYCHPYRSNAILTEYLAPFISKILPNQLFFFIRYKDPQYHIRIRFYNRKGNFGILHRNLEKLLNPLVQNGTISNIASELYIRELERYSPEIIKDVEHWFYTSSKFVLSYIANTSYKEQEPLYYKFAFITVNQIIIAFRLSDDKKERFFNFYFEAFAKEFLLATKSREQLRHKYRDMKVSGVFDNDLSELGIHDTISHEEISSFKLSLINLYELTSTWSTSRTLSLISDLIHMHLNRLFVDQSREQEMVVCFCMSSYYYSKKQRTRKAMNAIVSS